MRHKCKGRKLGSDWSHTQAMKRSLTQALLSNDRIKTTETRAKEIRRDVDRVITWAKKGDLHSRRLAIAALGNDKELVREIFEKVEQGMFKDRSGGYTRIMKLGPRKGDGAPMVIMELVTETCVPKAKREAAKATKATPKKKATKKDVKKAEEKIEADEKKADHESVIDEVKESIEAAEENFAAEVQEEGAEQLAEERAEAKADEKKAEKKAAKAAEEVREEQFEAEEAKARDIEAENPEVAEMPESVEKAK